MKQEKRKSSQSLCEVCYVLPAVGSGEETKDKNAFTAWLENQFRCILLQGMQKRLKRG